MTQHRLPAVWMRGGTSKGLFLHAEDLPADPNERDALLLRALGSPDPYGSQMDGVGGGTSSTSKVVLISRSQRRGCDVDYHFGHIAVEQPLVDWSGNCGNLTAAVGPFALEEGLVEPREPTTTVRIWQANLGERILAHVPVEGGAPAVDGDVAMAGVPGYGAGIRLDFLGAPEPRPVLPTSRPRDTLRIPGLGSLEASLVHAGNPTVFIRASDVGLKSTEQPGDIDDPTLLEALEAIRCAGAVAMGLADAPATVRRTRPATPKVAFVAPPCPMRDSAGQTHTADTLDVVGRILSMGRLHHAFTGTGAIALAVAARIPGTVVNAAARPRAGSIRLGHTAGRLEVDAAVTCRGGQWYADRVSVVRTARRLMEGAVLVKVRKT